MDKISVYIADDHPFLRHGLKTLIDNDARLVFSGEADNGVDALREVCELKPDVVIMDVSMPRLDGIEATKRIIEELPETRVIMLSAHSDIRLAIESFRAGAMGYVLKDSSPDELIKSVDKVLAGAKYASPAVAEELFTGLVDKAIHEKPDDPVDTLTAREREVIKHIADGATSKEIAGRLFISVATVKTHRNKIMKKLKVNDMASLIRTAIRKGIVLPD